MVTMRKRGFWFAFLLLGLTLLSLFSCGGGRYTIGGVIADSGGAGIPGVVVTMGDRECVSDSTGHFGFLSVANGSYTLVPFHQGVVLSPGSLAVTVHNDNVFGVKFTVYWLPEMSGTSVNLYSVAASGIGYVAVGAGGAIIASTDGHTWTSAVSGTVNTLYGVTFGNNRYVAVGTGGTMFTSTDGVIWTSGKMLTPNNLYKVAFMNNAFYAAGALGTIITSTDGNSWTLGNTGTTLDLYAMALDNNTYIAMGDNGTLLTSPNGSAWSVSNIGGSSFIRDVVVGGTNLVGVGNGTGNFYTSPNGIAWTAKVTEASGSPPSLNSVVYSNGVYVAAGNGGAVFYWSVLP